MDFLEKQFRYVSYFIQYTYHFILTIGKRPELNHLVKLLTPIKSKWLSIGHELGVDIDVIDDLNKSDEIKRNEVIQKWVETKPTPTTCDNIIITSSRSKHYICKMYFTSYVAILESVIVFLTTII